MFENQHTNNPDVELPKRMAIDSLSSKLGIGLTRVLANESGGNKDHYSYTRFLRELSAASSIGTTNDYAQLSEVFRIGNLKENEITSLLNSVKRVCEMVDSPTLLSDIASAINLKDYDPILATVNQHIALLLILYQDASINDADKTAIVNFVNAYDSILNLSEIPEKIKAKALMYSARGHAAVHKVLDSSGLHLIPTPIQDNELLECIERSLGTDIVSVRDDGEIFLFDVKRSRYVAVTELSQGYVPIVHLSKIVPYIVTQLAKMGANDLAEKVAAQYKEDKPIGYHVQVGVTRLPAYISLYGEPSLELQQAIQASLLDHNILSGSPDGVLVTDDERLEVPSHLQQRIHIAIKEEQIKNSQFGWTQFMSGMFKYGEEKVSPSVNRVLTKAELTGEEIKCIKKAIKIIESYSNDPEILKNLVRATAIHNRVLRENPSNANVAWSELKKSDKEYIVSSRARFARFLSSVSEKGDTEPALQAARIVTSIMEGARTSGNNDPALRSSLLDARAEASVITAYTQIGWNVLSPTYADPSEIFAWNQYGVKYIADSGGKDIMLVGIIREVNEGGTITITTSRGSIQYLEPFMRNIYKRYPALEGKNIRPVLIHVPTTPQYMDGVGRPTYRYRESFEASLDKY